MEKVNKIGWSLELQARLQAEGFLPHIIEEIKRDCAMGRGEIYQAGELIIISRVDALPSGGHEVVWVASLGRGLKKWAQRFYDAAARAGATYIRFHVDESDKREKLLLKLIKSWKPFKIEWQTNDADMGVYRVKLGG
ncbi:hypothetical protein [Vibrio sp. SCSIO 43137]|uniref:hypothetical protein n=1 Tax=Vibrio sp. SCSIO 43137 TaxID=3021011 RepID=UPI0023072059|nr:hypothetical protein [Vibrio sp. SCSIO 43137]WCE29969.1 hypothetical protein PK654_01260 [Vibrio sp. SCSIO 43137]